MRRDKIVGENSLSRFTFQPAFRIRTPRAYAHVFNADKKVHFTGKRVRMLCLPNSLTYPRVGIIVSKKYSNLAVKRNIVKRIIRESFRQKKEKIGCFDIVVIAKGGSMRSSKQKFIELDTQLKKTLREEIESLWDKLIKIQRAS